ncbi:MAG: hypothetical protein GXO78_06595 [Calditrichaeota bacterium]|nr:hypothetical protein [Calditrichota bacterium]
MKIILSVQLLCLFTFSITGGQQLETAKQAFLYFQEAEQIARQDNGKLWGQSLAGPMLFVDPHTRVVFANQADSAGHLKKLGEVYTAVLPKQFNMANTVLDWLGIRWSMILWPLPEDLYERRQLMMHESFHRIQERLGFPLANPVNRHLDDPRGRLWLRLEWEALRNALRASGDSLIFHLESALLFRQQRHRLFPEADSLETLLEFGEGLAEYTGVTLSGRKEAEIREYLLQRLQQAQTLPSFVRTFAYISVPVYGFLLDQSGFSWRSRLTLQQNISAMIQQAFGLKRATAPRKMIAERWSLYGGHRIQEEEEQRAAERKARIARYRQMFIRQPVIEIPLQNMNIQFDPRHIYPLDTLGTVYAASVRISDVWGTLTSTGAVLIRPDWKTAQIPAAGIDPLSQKASITGNGWTLEINTGWKLVRETGDNRYRLIPHSGR